MLRTGGTGADKQLYRSMEEQNDFAWDDRKKYLKRRAFELVADQTGKLSRSKYLYDRMGQAFCWL